MGSNERQAATPAGKATAEDRREWGSRGSWSVARGKRPPSRDLEQIRKAASKDRLLMQLLFISNGWRRRQGKKKQYHSDSTYARINEKIKHV
jgi:hypothetical protein